MIIIDGNTLWQWDKGRRVKIKPRQGLTVCSVEYSKPGHAEAIRTEHKEVDGFIVSAIPNILLQTPENLTVYVVYSTADSEFTYESAVFFVSERPKPPDYVYTETEIYTIQTAVDKALREAKASGEFKGADGKDGKDGKTPVKGVDYWTEADKAEIKEYVDDAILGGAW